MKTWVKKYGIATAMGFVCVGNLLMWTPINCFIAGILLVGTLNELNK